MCLCTRDKGKPTEGVRKNGALGRVPGGYGIWWSGGSTQISQLIWSDMRELVSQCPFSCKSFGTAFVFVIGGVGCVVIFFCLHWNCVKRFQLDFTKMLIIYCRRASSLWVILLMPKLLLDSFELCWKKEKRHTQPVPHTYFLDIFQHSVLQTNTTHGIYIRLAHQTPQYYNRQRMCTRSPRDGRAKCVCSGHLL